ncbi:hypothetical protein CRUP_018284 [Coryphaenoides rupestris]|nr:hypothetical protein CRUP_018284 [Coryphaenoides rupestris]
MADLKPDMSDQDLFWGSDQYDFSMVLHASAQHCFWHFAHEGENFYLTYQVQWVTGLGHDSHLSVTVNSPSSLLVSSVDDATGQVDFKTTETGPKTQEQLGQNLPEPSPPPCLVLDWTARPSSPAVSSPRYPGRLPAPRGHIPS